MAQRETKIQAPPALDGPSPKLPAEKESPRVGRGGTTVPADNMKRAEPGIPVTRVMKRLASRNGGRGGRR